jgi:triphosphoribosyl-dephospho-CoA synthase
MPDSCVYFPSSPHQSCGLGAGLASDPRDMAHARPAIHMTIAKFAIRSLHAELVLYPKPGLVSPVDNGSHDDMNSRVFMRSIFSLRHYFFQMAQAGAAAAPFKQLKQFGREAEHTMLRATGGINTHRGAIFSLGLLCAAAGHLVQHAASRYRQAMTAEDLRNTLLAVWGQALAMHSITNSDDSNGLRAASKYGVSGAREEAARGFPSVFEIALPRLHQTLAAGRSNGEAQIDALFSLMASMHDTNIYHRGDSAAADLVRHSAQQFLAAGGTAQPDWHASATHYHQLFVQRRLSPGGAADLLSATWFVHLLTEDKLNRNLPLHG